MELLKAVCQAMVERLRRRTGLQVDGYGGCEAPERRRSEEIVLAHCLANVRRYAIGAEAEAPH